MVVPCRPGVLCFVILAWSVDMYSWINSCCISLFYCSSYFFLSVSLFFFLSFLLLTFQEFQTTDCTAFNSLLARKGPARCIINRLRRLPSALSCIFCFHAWWKADALRWCTILHFFFFFFFTLRVSNTTSCIVLPLLPVDPNYHMNCLQRLPSAPSSIFCFHAR